MHWGEAPSTKGMVLFSLLCIPSPTSSQSWEALLVCGLGDGARQGIVTGRKNTGKDVIWGHGVLAGK